MATTDYEIQVHEPLASYVYDLKVKYKNTNGLTKRQFMKQFRTGELTLSTAVENLFVAAAKYYGVDITKVSEHARDFSNNGDMKIGILKLNGIARRFVISDCKNKIGTIYFLGWNWMTNKPHFYAIPKSVYGSPKQGIKIPVHRITGEITGGKYNACAKDSFKDMVLA